MYGRIFSILLAGILIFVSNVSALTGNDVEKFIQITSKLIPYFEDMEDDEKNFDESDFEINNITERFIQQMTGHSEMHKIVRAGGFSSVQEWAEVASKVFMAVASIELKENLGSFEESMEALRHETAGMGLTEEQLEMYEMQVRSAMTVFDEAPQSDIDAVTPYIEEIKKILEWE